MVVVDAIVAEKRGYASSRLAGEGRGMRETYVSRVGEPAGGRTGTVDLTSLVEVLDGVAEAAAGRSSCRDGG